MFAKGAILAITYLSLFLVRAAPIPREVPQEHSHEKYLTLVRASLALDNPQNLGDPVFALLGNAAAQQGLGDSTDPDCLQQAIADQAFTNAKAANDVDGMVGALVYRALERNSGKVGAASNACTSVTAANPEIAALQQHQDPASDGAADTNKQITLELARQIASVGGDPQQALESGTFAPGDVNDPTAAGNTCDDQNDTEGCIFTQNLLVEDATAEEIEAAVSGSGSSSSASSSGVSGGAAAVASGSSSTASAAASSSTASSNSGSIGCGGSADSSSSSSNNSGGSSNSSSNNSGNANSSAASATSSAAASAASSASSSSSSDSSSSSSSSSTSGNLQTFTGSLGGAAPAVTPGGRGFQVEGNDDFLNAAAALGRSCDVQHNKCANAANSGGGFSVGDCDQQNTECRAAASA
ncbi:uncharacterized protein SCHCODRAFT_02615369 [Schizophyllum commune H4-8]|nr:uncharacterized protein SCHCODRAFT_02615369 [Schizophyllum commune H4-8]KAI5896623.1 hypothetical protein SCHCODRAFT_02615369 [Schizophyllum commune H4-8]